MQATRPETFGAAHAVTQPPVPGTDAALSIYCRDINVRFFTDRRSTTAIEGLSLDVANGECLTLLGPSGCGKSTFLRVVADLVKASNGQVSVFGAAPAVARARRDIDFVFQDAALLPWRTALQNVELPLEVAKGKSRAGKARPRRASGADLIGQWRATIRSCPRIPPHCGPSRSERNHCHAC